MSCALNSWLETPLILLIIFSNPNNSTHSTHSNLKTIKSTNYQTESEQTTTMAALHLPTIIEGIHARMAELPVGNKTDDTILKVLFEQISLEYTEVKDQEEEAKRQMKKKEDELKEVLGVRNPKTRKPATRTLRKEKRDLRTRKAQPRQ